jgi:adenylylsulfate kinase
MQQKRKMDYERTIIFARLLIKLLTTNMPSLSENIFPVFHEILDRSAKEKLLNQRSKVIWLTGLSGAGKTTIAKHLEIALVENGFFTQILDGDNIRSGINNNLGFSDADRFENIRRIAEISKLFVNCGVITINCFISPTEDIREMARRIIGADDFIEIYVNAPLNVCEDRDVKGLYSKARRGEIKEFTGITSPFETPQNYDIELRTDLVSVDESVKQVMQLILPRIEYR